MPPKLATPTKPILKTSGSPTKRPIQPEDTTSPGGSGRVSFSHESHRKERPLPPSLEDLLKAAQNSEKDFFDDSAESLPRLSEGNTNSQNSGQSHSSTGSVHEELKDKGEEYELTNPDAHLIINEEVMQLITTQIHELIFADFSSDPKGYEFSTRIIRNNCYNKRNVNVTQSRKLVTEEEIRAQRIQELTPIHRAVTQWLQKVSLLKIVNTLRDQANKIYPSDKFAALFFERYLFAVLENARSLHSYSSAQDTLESVFSCDNEEDNTVAAQHTRFSQKLLLLRQTFFQPHTFAAALFEQYLLTNIELFFAIAINKKEFDLEFSGKIITLQERFSKKLTATINILPASIPLSQTWYMLWLHGQELLAQEDPYQLTIKKFRLLFAASRQDNEQNSITLSNELMRQLPTDLSSCYFKKNPKTNEKTFTTREDMQQTVAWLKHIPFKCGYATFYRQTQETLEIFSRKEEIRSSHK